MTRTAFFGLALLSSAAAACGGSPSSAANPAEAQPSAAETSASPAASSPTPATGAPASSATADGKSTELIGKPIQEPTPGADDPKKLERDAQLGASVAMKSGHGKCIKTAHEKHPDFKPNHYEITVTIKADGTVAKVDVDKAKSDVSDPKFLPCVVSKLKEATFTAPGREVSARLVYPE
jgi:ABC-type transport system substrate-binding protein